MEIKLGSRPEFVKHVFFKSFPEVVLGSPLRGLRERSTQCIESSSKFGVLFITGQESLLILRAEDALSAQVKAKNDHKKQVDLTEIPHLRVNNPSFGSAPSFVAISNGEEFIAFDTQKNGVPFILVFKLDQFLVQAGGSSPFCEVRGSANEGAKVSGIAWNPGENMGSMFAITCDDGSLQLATIKGEKSVEMCSLKDRNAKTMCWSPKGKQLVVGRNNGNLSQLKLDLSEAKQIPGPGGGRIPSAIFWSSTTQFLINFIVDERDIDFMQLDLVKGAPQSYSSFGDIFVSDYVSGASKCFFVPILSWNTMLCASNTINDLMVVLKGLQGVESWTVADIDDTRRAAIPIDSFAVGATLFTGWETNVTFSETETFGPMPVLFTLSDSGALCSVSVVNSDPNFASIIHPVSNPLPPGLFTLKREAPAVATPTNSPAPPAYIAQSNTAASQSPQLAALLNNPPAAQTGNQSSPTMLNNLTFVKTQQQVEPPKQAQVIPSQKLGSSSILGQNFLSSGLPTPQQVEELKRIVEERRAQGERQGEIEESNYEHLSLELEKFQIRMSNFTRKQVAVRNQMRVRLDEVCKKFEQEVLTGLNILEDFVGAIEETTKCQKDEVNMLKERILSHFSQLEYAKSIAERNKDPKYIQLLRAQPLDPATLLKFQNVQKMFQYVKNQTNECDRFFQAQNRESRPLEGAAATQVIYQTLSNHSRIIKRLVQDLNAMRTQLGLSKCKGLDSDMDVFQFPSLGYFEKKPIPTKSKSDYVTEMKQSDRITYDDLTAGISRVKLDKESEFLGSKPLKITAKKLQVLRKAVSKTIDIEVSNEIQDWDDPLSKSPKPQSRELIKMLDDKSMPPKTSNINEKGDGYFVKPPSATVSPSSTTFVPLPTKEIARTSPQQQQQVTSSFQQIPTKPFGQISSLTGIASKPSTFVTNPVSTPTKPSLFGTLPASSSPQSSLFGTSNISFSSPAPSTPFGTQIGSTISFGTKTSSPSSQPSLLGTPSATANSNSQSNLFAAAATTPTVAPSSSLTSSFGTKSVSISSQPSLLGTATVSSNSQSSLFATPTVDISSLTSSFGTKSPTKLSLFGNLPAVSSSPQTSLLLGTSGVSSPATTSSFGAPITQIASTNSFGTSSQPSLLGTLSSTANSNSQSNLFAATTPTVSASSSLTSSFGTKSIITTSSQPPTTSASTNAPLTLFSTPTADVSSLTSAFGTQSVNTTSSQPGLLGTATVSSNSSIFTTPTADISSLTSSFGTQSVSSPTKPSLFGSNPQPSLFGTPTVGSSSPATTTFGTQIESTSAQSSLFGPPPTLTTAPNQGVFSSGSSGVFGGSSTFGGGSPSIFGSGAFGAATTNASQQPSLFGTPSSTAPSVNKPAGAFGSGAVFGGTPAFGSSSPFGSAFGSAAPAVSSGFGASSGVFGGGGGSSSPSIFGSGAFGASTTTNAPQQSSLLGTPPAPSVAKSAGGFGSAPVFGGTPAFGSSSPFGSAFGSTGSPSASMGFGGSSGGGSSIFGGATAQQSAPSFGALAQTSPQQSTFGGFGSSPSPFGGQPQQQQASPFGQVQQPPQQQASAFGQPPPAASSSFGGSAFSSWR